MSTTKVKEIKEQFLVTYFSQNTLGFLHLVDIHGVMRAPATSFQPL